jgi:hypothetical protein
MILTIRKLACLAALDVRVYVLTEMNSATALELGELMGPGVQALGAYDDVEYIALSVMADVVVLSESESVWLAALFTDALKLVSDSATDARQFQMLDDVVSLTSANLTTRISQVIEQRLSSAACATAVAKGLSADEKAFRACGGRLSVAPAAVPVSLHSAPIFDVTKPRNTAKPVGVAGDFASAMVVSLMFVTIVIAALCWQWTAGHTPKRKYTF